MSDVGFPKIWDIPVIRVAVCWVYIVYIGFPHLWKRQFLWQFQLLPPACFYGNGLGYHSVLLTLNVILTTRGLG